MSSSEKALSKNYGFGMGYGFCPHCPYRRYKPSLEQFWPKGFGFGRRYGFCPRGRFCPYRQRWASYWQKQRPLFGPFGKYSLPGQKTIYWGDPTRPPVIPPSFYYENFRNRNQKYFYLLLIFILFFLFIFVIAK